MLQGKPDIFWRLHEKTFSKIPDLFSSSFKELFYMMVHPDPTKRAKIFTEEEPKEDDYFIENSDWYTQTREATLDEV